MLTRDLTPCFVQDFGLSSRTGYEKALLVGLFDRTFTCLDHRISSTDEDAGPTRRPVAVVMRRDGQRRRPAAYVRPSDASREKSEGRFDTLPALGDADGLVLEVANDVGCVQRDRREL